MKAWLLAALLVFPPATVAKRSVAYCPELAEGSGLVWEYLEGGDFIGCIAARQSDDARLFGVYLGQHPSFVADPSKRKAKGIVGGRNAHWQLPGPRSDEGVVLETHLQLQGTEMDPPLQSVVWVYTSSRGNYEQAFRAIARMKFRANWLDRPN
jgi:hypothetical protein